MRTTRTDLEGGRTGCYATITRPCDSDRVVVTILTPNEPGGRTLRVEPDDESNLWETAAWLQNNLDGLPGAGVRGTNTDIHAYLRELQRFQD